MAYLGIRWNARVCNNLIWVRLFRSWHQWAAGIPRVQGASAQVPSIGLSFGKPCLGTPVSAAIGLLRAVLQLCPL